MNARFHLYSAVTLAFAPFGTFPAHAAHSGAIDQPGIEVSDIALFAIAVLGVWLARRSMRARAKARRSPGD